MKVNQLADALTLDAKRQEIMSVMKDSSTWEFSKTNRTLVITFKADIFDNEAMFLEDLKNLLNRHAAVKYEKITAELKNMGVDVTQ